MTRTAFNQIMEGLQAAVRYAEGDEAGAVVHVPETIDVRGVRKTLKLSQEQFAARYNIGLARLRDWEQGRSWPDSAMRAYLTVILKEHEAVDRALRAA
ncbi:helix-turn-helix domain-containing protein [Mesorhizobium sp. LHD-90]|uniref:helix-turn-helix domain-containing protein n=1 Tax=Mesorhizobium sp. LHD-90 TaxID=3071414 RepID=UPI0027E06CDA|nr:helix-turn-helix domain-containing protein [Mesorhizobium sp. LHD-90]MDQ6436507.1 helix-turn-helix domain-containing protein [Mesorhizobium sp. LHD-90]